MQAAAGWRFATSLVRGCTCAGPLPVAAGDPLADTRARRMRGGLDGGARPWPRDCGTACGRRHTSHRSARYAGFRANPSIDLAGNKGIAAEKVPISNPFLRLEAENFRSFIARIGEMRTMSPKSYLYVRSPQKEEVVQAVGRPGTDAGTTSR